MQIIQFSFLMLHIMPMPIKHGLPTRQHPVPVPVYTEQGIERNT